MAHSAKARPEPYPILSSGPDSVVIPKAMGILTACAADAKKTGESSKKK